jgi:putative peptidoglycan lipid II flippase
MGPRVLTVLAIQIMFLTRDNLASYLNSGSVSALTYGYFIMQVPETLIGTAIATALLPTLSQFAAQKNMRAFSDTLNKSLRVITSVTLVLSVVGILTLDYFIQIVFHFDAQSSSLLSSVTKVYLIGLIFQCLLEVTTRTFYARLDTKTPFFITFLRVILYVFLAVTLVKFAGAAGLAWADTLTTAVAVIVMLWMLMKKVRGLLVMKDTIKRVLLTCTISLGLYYLFFTIFNLSGLVGISSYLLIAAGISFILLKNELKLLLKL